MAKKRGKKNKPQPTVKIDGTTKLKVRSKEGKELFLEEFMKLIVSKKTEDVVHKLKALGIHPNDTNGAGTANKKLTKKHAECMQTSVRGISQIINNSAPEIRKVLENIILEINELDLDTDDESNADTGDKVKEIKIEYKFLKDFRFREREFGKEYLMKFEEILQEFSDASDKIGAIEDTKTRVEAFRKSGLIPEIKKRIRELMPIFNLAAYKTERRKTKVYMSPTEKVREIPSRASRFHDKYVEVINALVKQTDNTLFSFIVEMAAEYTTRRIFTHTVLRSTIDDEGGYTRGMFFDSNEEGELYNVFLPKLMQKLAKDKQMNVTYIHYIAWLYIGNLYNENTENILLEDIDEKELKKINDDLAMEIQLMASYSTDLPLAYKSVDTKINGIGKIAIHPAKELSFRHLCTVEVYPDEQRKSQSPVEYNKETGEIGTRFLWGDEQTLYLSHQGDLEMLAGTGEGDLKRYFEMNPIMGLLIEGNPSYFQYNSLITRKGGKVYEELRHQVLKAVHESMTTVYEEQTLEEFMQKQKEEEEQKKEEERKSNYCIPTHVKGLFITGGKATEEALKRAKDNNITLGPSQTLLITDDFEAVQERSEVYEKIKEVKGKGYELGGLTQDDILKAIGNIGDHFIVEEDKGKGGHYKVTNSKTNRSASVQGGSIPEGTLKKGIMKELGISELEMKMGIHKKLKRSIEKKEKKDEGKEEEEK